MNQSTVATRLLRHGLILFLAGLGSGLVMLAADAMFKNLRMALASHLVGVTGGMFLLILGLLANRVRLKERLWKVAFWTAIFGGYGNWAGTLLAAIFGTHALSAVTGAGHSGAGWQEFLVGALLTTSGTATIVACLVFLSGLREGEGKSS